jgi:ferritin heavy chain
MADFIESNFLHEQTESIKELSGYITNLERVGEGLGVYQFDKLTLGDD